jgi:hypothetical protein
MRLLCIALLIALPTAIFAQSNYHEGYVLKNNGDTLKGFINYREWERSPKSIQFKINKTDKATQEFTPQTIREFQITGMEYYISHSGVISMDRTNFPDIPDGLDTSKELSTLFLKQLVTGSHLTLYYNKDDTKTRFFTAENKGDIIELEYHQYYSDERDMIEKTRYRGQLIFYINKYDADNTSLINTANRSRYIQTDLEEIVNKINGPGSIVNNKLKAKNTRLFTGIGLNYTEAQFYYGGYLYGSIFSSKTISPKLNFGADVFINPNVQQFALRAELSFSYINPKFNLPYGQVYTFNQYTASITPQILFNFYNKDTFKAYIDGGISFNFSAYTNDKITGQTNSDLQKKPYDLEPYWANFPLQTGIIINKKIEAYFSYTAFAAYTKYTSLSVANRSMNVGIKYLFNTH